MSNVIFGFKPLLLLLLPPPLPLLPPPSSTIIIMIKIFSIICIPNQFLMCFRIRREYGGSRGVGRVRVYLCVCVYVRVKNAVGMLGRPGQHRPIQCNRLHKFKHNTHSHAVGCALCGIGKRFRPQSMQLSNVLIWKFIECA